MRTVGGALVAGIRAPVARWKLVCILWIGRLLPVLLVFGLPLYAKALVSSAHHPDAGRLIGGGGEFTHTWTQDLLRNDLTGLPETLFWLILFAWLLTTVLAGGIVARLIHGGAGPGLFLAECGRYAGRFLRLACLVAVSFYALDVLCNTLLAQAHQEARRLHMTQRYGVEKEVVRGLLFGALVYLLGLLHAYARIEIVAHERRSALLALLRALATLLLRLPKLFVLEIGMLLAAGAAAGVAWFLMAAGRPADPGAGWIAVGGFLLLGAVGSYLRSGIELGAMEARCRLLASAVATVSPSQFETPRPYEVEEEGDLFVPRPPEEA